MADLPVLSRQTKLKLFLDLEWIFEQLAHKFSVPAYSEMGHPWRLNCIEFLRKHLKLSDRVLDIGCKEGKLIAGIAPFVSSVLAIDLDEKALSKARRNFSEKNIEFKAVSGFEFLENSTEKFDVVLLSHVLEHVDEPEKLLHLAGQVARQVYVEVPDFDRTFLNQYRLKANSQFLYSEIDHIFEFTRNDMEEMIARNGLRVVDREFVFGNMRFWCELKKESLC